MKTQPLRGELYPAFKDDDLKTLVSKAVLYGHNLGLDHERGKLKDQPLYDSLQALEEEVYSHVLAHSQARVRSVLERLKDDLEHIEEWETCLDLDEKVVALIDAELRRLDGKTV